MPQRLPTRPSTGPPPACPIASAWPLIDRTVARTLESVICSLSQIVRAAPRGCAQEDAEERDDRDPRRACEREDEQRDQLEGGAAEQPARDRARPPRSTRLRSTHVPTNPLTMPTSQKMPNQVTELGSPTAAVRRRGGSAPP